MRRTVIRDWKGTRRTVAVVSTAHPLAGPLLRGTIRALPSPDWRGRWWVLDHDHDLVGDGPVVGDYLDAEAALLAATAGMDEES